jgi:hypothetical protein
MPSLEPKPAHEIVAPDETVEHRCISAQRLASWRARNSLPDVKNAQAQSRAMRMDEMRFSLTLGASGKRIPIRTTCTARLLPLVLLLTLPAVVQAQDFAYTISNSIVTIIGYGGSNSVVTIPGTIENLPVASIGDFAFYNRTNVTSVTIPNTVTNIGTRAFAFCTSLAGVTIPDSVTRIGEWAFASCASVTTVAIPQNVSSIGSYALYDCASLSAITVDSLNSSYSSVDGVLFNKSTNTLIQCPGAKAGGYAVPPNVTSIESGAFFNCLNLGSVTIPNSVITIGYGAFDSCTSLTNITIPNNLTGIDDWTFAKCWGLQSVTLPNSLTSIGRYAFYYCAALTSITIPNNVTNIGIGAFANCGDLQNITIPTNVASIGDRAFYWCTNLTGLHFKGNPPSVGSDAFYNATNATVYSLPGNTNWGTNFGGLPTALWKPRMLTSDASFGVRTNQFGFTISWAGGMVVAVEACTDPANPGWTPLQTNTLTSDTLYFSDSQWTNHPARFYRLRWP